MKRNMMGKVLLLTVILTTLLSLFAFPGFSFAADKKYTLYYVDHGTPGNPFWAVYFRGIEDAAELLKPYGVEVKHLSAEADVKKQIDMLKIAVATNPDGLVTSMIDPKTFDPILRPAVEKGMALMAVNVEDPRPVGERIPYLTYYGEDTWKSGVELAAAFIKYVKDTNGFKPKHVLLCNPMAGHYVWEARLQKFGESLEKEYGTKQDKVVVGEDPTKAMEIIRASLVKNPDIDVICAPVHFTHANVSLVKELGREAGKDIYLCCFDMMPETLLDIKEGRVVCTHDQQQYLQGFLPLLDLYLYLSKQKVHPYGIVSTGPIIIDKSNVDTVIEGAKAGYR
ncbi:MAG: substrate-binding domain-containing protein [Candidatus Atribacteria bacterium]|nr:substrate-binding domain-containing protein [Candidatus Atribacteria bacterium]